MKKPKEQPSEEILDPRDHRVIGKKLNLFTFSDTVGKGLPLWTAKGAAFRRELEKFVVNTELKWGYQHVYTPDIAKLDLYKKSGHYPYYKETMYSPIKIDDEEYMLRPMTCPHHFELYLSEPRSYRDLPMRIAELAKLYRYELSGVLTGLTRVRSFCLADAHIICANEDQAKTEIAKALDLIDHMSNIFGLKMGVDYRYRLSLGDRSNKEKYFDDPTSWDKSEDILRSVLKERKSDFLEAQNEAAFYGPKIDMQMKKANGTEETAFTVQYDFVMPKRFNLSYINEAGQEEQPIVIHRSSIGAIERVMAFLIERYNGSFPVWLSPIQIKVLPITDRNIKYSQEVIKSLSDENVRAELDDRSETLQAKIRDAQVEKIPYMLVVGDREEKEGKVAVRLRTEKDLGQMTLEEFLSRIKEKIDKKLLDL